MSIDIYPSYYGRFRCKADKCLHSCCKGWEIDIDSGSLEKYAALEGCVAEKIRASVVYEENPHFRLDKDERCPMLREDGLCEIILAYGEDALCEICSLHPRFRNFYSDAVENGLGLCCEAAAEIIVGETEKFSLCYEGEGSFDETESAMLKDRSELFSILQDRAVSVNERFAAVLDYAGMSTDDIDLAKWAERLGTLEILDSEWKTVIGRLKDRSLNDAFCADETCLEQLAVYFLYRHFPGATNDGMFEERAAFAVISALIIAAVSAGQDDIADSAHMYSSEIEYSDENLGMCLDYIGEDRDNV